MIAYLINVAVAHVGSHLDTESTHSLLYLLMAGRKRKHVEDEQVDLPQATSSTAGPSTIPDVPSASPAKRSRTKKDPDAPKVEKRGASMFIAVNSLGFS